MLDVFKDECYGDTSTKKEKKIITEFSFGSYPCKPV